MLDSTVTSLPAGVEVQGGQYTGVHSVSGTGAGPYSYETPVWKTFFSGHLIWSFGKIRYLSPAVALGSSLLMFPGF